MVAPIPPRTVNGGLYTGEPFAAGAQYANVPIVPDAGVMLRDGLHIGNSPPPGANMQYVSWQRPGNSSPQTPGLVRDEWTQLMFAPCQPTSWSGDGPQTDPFYRDVGVKRPQKPSSS